MLFDIFVLTSFMCCFKPERGFHQSLYHKPEYNFFKARTYCLVEKMVNFRSDIR